MECIGRRSSILEIRNDVMIGEIYIETGAITHAAVGELAGVKAFNKLLCLSGGEFRMKLFTPPAQRTVEQPWEYLLMDAARCRDEETDLLDRKASETETRVKVAAPEPSESPESSETPAAARADNGDPGDEFVVVATYDGEWTPVDASRS
jgi:hypothetical protein